MKALLGQYLTGAWKATDVLVQGGPFRMVVHTDPFPGSLGNATSAVLVGATLLVLAGCQRSLPTAPSELTTGMVVYEHANFLGQSAHIANNVADLKDFTGPCETEIDTPTLPSQLPTTTTVRNWNDCISSIRVSAGWQATIYRDSDFRGQSLDIVSDVANLQLVMGSCSHDGLNDCISSIRVSSK